MIKRIVRVISCAAILLIVVFACVLGGAVLAGSFVAHILGLPIGGLGELFAVVAFAIVGGYYGYMLYADFLRERIVVLFGQTE